MMGRIFTAIVVAVAAEGAVTDLTTDSFDAFLADNKHVLTAFVAPWCGHCQKLKPAYQEAAQKLADDGSAVKLAYVDATAETALKERFEVEGFPTLKFFTDGKASEFSGGRSAKDIVAWIDETTGPAVRVATEQPEPVKGKPVVVLTGAKTEAFEAFAAENRKLAQFYHVESADATKVSLQHHGEDVKALEGEPTKETLGKFVRKYKLPLFAELNAESYQMYMESKMGLVWSLFEMSEGDVASEVAAKYAETMKKVADEFQGEIVMTYTHTVEFKDALKSMWSVTEFPRIVYNDVAGGKKKWIYDGEIDADKIIDFLKKAKSGEIPAERKSEDVPAENDGPIFKVVGSKMNEALFDAERDVLFAVTAPWCGHCKELHPEFTKVGKRLKKEGFDGFVRLAEMDGTANDSYLGDVTWSGFPTMFWIKAGTKEVVSYNAGRTAKDMWKFIKKNSSHSEKILEATAARKKAKKDSKEEL